MNSPRFLFSCVDTFHYLIRELKEDILERDANKENLEQNVTDLNEILLTTAQKTFRTFKQHKKSRNRKKTTNEWFDRDCKAKRNVLRKLSKTLSKEPFNKQRLTSFLKARADYKKICRKAEKKYRGKLTNQLLSIGKQDAKSFWEIISKMNN